jgi:hypothetical protein
MGYDKWHQESLKWDMAPMHRQDMDMESGTRWQDTGYGTTKGMDMGLSPWAG